MNASRINFVVRMQHWMDSVPGQTFLNYAYSWGASIVILGTLFKLTHLPAANLMLFIGMGTEVFVFFISAFDRPFDKTDMNRELSDELPSDEEISEKMSGSQQGVVAGGGSGSFVIGSGGTSGVVGGGAAAAGGSGTPVSGGVGGGMVIIGGGGVVGGARGSMSNGSVAGGEGGEPIEGGVPIEGQPAPVLTPEVAQVAVEDLEAATKEYAEKLKLLTETLDRVEKQSARLTTDSEEMTNLNRTLTGINTVYELQLKSISKQVGAIDQINEQTHRMAEQIEALNGIYSRMIKALTVNMKNAAEGAAGPTNPIL